MRMWQLCICNYLYNPYFMRYISYQVFDRKSNTQNSLCIIRHMVAMDTGRHHSAQQKALWVISQTGRVQMLSMKLAWGFTSYDLLPLTETGKQTFIWKKNPVYVFISFSFEGQSRLDVHSCLSDTENRSINQVSVMRVGVGQTCNSLWFLFLYLKGHRWDHLYNPPLKPSVNKSRRL